MYTSTLVINSSRENARSTLSQMVNDPNSKVVRLTPHLRLRLLQAGSVPEATDLDLTTYRLESEVSPSSVLTLGTLVSKQAEDVPSSQQSPTVLIEHKSYLPPPDAHVHSDMVQYKSKLQSQVQRLASVLSSAGDDDLKTLSFRGYIDQQSFSRHAFVFTFPDDASHSVPGFFAFDH